LRVGRPGAPPAFSAVRVRAEAQGQGGAAVLRAIRLVATCQGRLKRVVVVGCCVEACLGKVSEATTESALKCKGWDRMSASMQLAVQSTAWISFELVAHGRRARNAQSPGRVAPGTKWQFSAVGWAADRRVA
jgi:hypothetical protein